MNNIYYPNNYPGEAIYPNSIPKPEPINNFNLPASLPEELSTEKTYIENILFLNHGKVAKVHMNFPESNEWRDKVFSGIIEKTGSDHIILSDPATGKWYLLPIVYLSFIEFEEKIKLSSNN